MSQLGGVTIPVLATEDKKWTNSMTIDVIRLQ